MNEKLNGFTIRVYGVLINEKKQTLVADEQMHGAKFTKFPGGGLKFGEGPIDCLKRECMEEMRQEIEVLEHFYTIDFFQESIFKKGKQLISIYYLIEPKGEIQFQVTKTKFDIDFSKEEDLAFRWVKISEKLVDEMTFPVDKKVAEMLVEKFG
ncbi:MAG: NUDIX hydrolase [Flavobacteriales bacterium]|nr:MAG: NUDIX hydrolase [Flavobacteriales bacterium]